MALLAIQVSYSLCAQCWFAGHLPRPPDVAVDVHLRDGVITHDRGSVGIDANCTLLHGNTSRKYHVWRAQQLEWEDEWEDK